MEYPEEIYATRNGGTLASKDMQVNGSSWGRRHAYEVGYEAGKAVRAEQADPLEVYSNLTAALKSGDPIDYEKLDGRKVQLVSPGVGELKGVLTRNERLKPNLPDAWWAEEMSASYIHALYDGWHGKNGWSLWIEGDIPLVRKTADQLDYYTYFYGHTPGEKPVMAYVGGSREPWSGRRVHYAPCMATSLTRASKWVVLEEYGTFQKPEGK